MQAATAFLNKKYRPQGCCCFSLKVGTTIIGIVDICLITIKLILRHEMSVVEIKENSAVIFIRGESDAAIVFATMFRFIFLIAAALMIYGNFKGNKEPMLPFVYLKFIGLIVVTITDLVVLPLTLSFLGKVAEALTILVIAIISIVVGTYFWHIVQCRILEIKETVHPETLFTYGDPEIPAYSNVRDTSVPSGGITSSTDVGSQILQ